jgi:hypothetical protein
MATIKELEQAFIAADEAGNSEDAAAFAAEIQRLRAAPAPSRASELARQAGLTARAGIAGLASLPTMVGDVVNTGLNYIPGVNLQMPSQATQELMTKAGLPEPQNTTERMVQAGAGAMAGAGGQLKAFQAGRELLQGAAPVTEGVLGSLGAQPVAQMGSAAPSAMAAQYTGEATGSPLAAMLAGVTAGGVTGIRPRQAEVGPLASTVKAEATAAYNVADQAGIMIKPTSFNSAIVDIEGNLKAAGFSPLNHPNIANSIKDLKTASKQGTLTLSEVDRLRQSIRSAAPSSDDNQKRLTGIAIKSLDDFVNNLSFKDVNSIDPKAGVIALKEARSLWQKTKKAEIIDDIMDSAEIRGYAPNASEGDILRRSVITLAANKSKMAQFSETEQNMIKSAAKGGNLQRVLQIFEMAAPGKSLSSLARAGGIASLGGLVGGPLGAATAPLVGLAARGAATSMSNRSARELQQSLLLGRQLQTTSGGAAVPATAMRGLFGSYGLELPQQGQ